MEEDVKGLGDYIAILRRHKAMLVVPALLIFLIGSGVAFSLPPSYKAEGTILIEQQEIPRELVQSTITTYADQRIQLISQRVMTSENLVKIIDEFDLYPEMRANEGMSGVLDRVRRDIGLETVSADVIDPRTGKPREATIAFSVSYRNEAPQLAQAVANQLVSLYLDENIRSRTEAAADTSEFLSTEAKRLSKKVSEIEQAIAEFKDDNAGRLPELMTMNLQRLSRLERDLLGAQGQMRQIEERRVYLESELVQLSPNALMYSATGERMFGPLDRLRALEADYVAKSARYSEDHPDLTRMRQEMAALRSEVGDADTGGLEVQLKGLRTQQISLLDRYSEQHPDVLAVQRQIRSIERQLANAQSQRRGPLPTSRPDNPAYIQLQTQLQAADVELRGIKLTEAEIRAKMTDIEGRISAAPYLERELAMLTRDLDNALSKYREIKAKEMEAQLAEVLEAGQKGEKLTLVEPPLVPAKPDKPNRPVLLFVSLVLSFAGGVGSVALREALDDSIHDARGLIDLTDMAPLSVVPYIESDRQRRLRLIRGLLYGLITLAVIAGVLNYVHHNQVPLDVLWFQTLERFGIES